jgi:hypothetical protein
MHHFSYLIRVWVSGILLTPIVYGLLLIPQLGFHLPQYFGELITSYILPYTLLASVWMLLGIFCAILLAKGYSKKMVRGSIIIVAAIMSFIGFTLIHAIAALQSYNNNFLLFLAYAVSTIFFVWVYDSKLSADEQPVSVNLIGTVKNAIIYGLTVWLFSFLFSVPATMFVLYLTKSFNASPAKTALAILERYNMQFSLSITYFITLVLICIITTCLNLSDKKSKLIFILFALPLSLPALVYYLLFTDTLFSYNFLDLLVMAMPSMIISAICIWFIDIVPGRKTA